MWTATHKQLVVGKKTASFVGSVLNQLPSVSGSPKQISGTVSSMHTYLYFCDLFSLQDCLYLFENFGGIRGGVVGVTMHCDCSGFMNVFL